MMMDKFLAPNTHEANANNHLTENWPIWNTDQPSVDESLISGGASYRSFERYINGEDLFILPGTRIELENVLRRYARDAIHNTIAICRSPIQTGGYSRVCHLAATSITDVLNTGDNAEILLAYHLRDPMTSTHDVKKCNCNSSRHTTSRGG